jgi:hypothetical protein
MKVSQATKMKENSIKKWGFYYGSFVPKIMVENIVPLILSALAPTC